MWELTRDRRGARIVRGGEGTGKVLRLSKSTPAWDLALQHTAPLKQAGCRRIYDKNVSGAKGATNPS